MFTTSAVTAANPQLCNGVYSFARHALETQCSVQHHWCLLTGGIAHGFLRVNLQKYAPTYGRFIPIHLSVLQTIL